MTYMKFKSQERHRPVYIGSFRCTKCGCTTVVETSNKFYVPKCDVCNKPMKEVYTNGC